MKEEDFLDWIVVKITVDTNSKVPHISEGEVFWCACGENVGIEINGKNELFSRPVIILKKLSKLGFMGIPLTSQRKTGSWYAEIEFLGKKQFAAVCQARVMSVHRLYSKIGRIPESDLLVVKKAFLKLYE